MKCLAGRVAKQYNASAMVESNKKLHALASLKGFLFDGFAPAGGPEFDNQCFAPAGGPEFDDDIIKRISTLWSMG